MKKWVNKKGSKNPNFNRNLLIGIVIIVLLVGGFFLFGQSDDKLDSNILEPEVTELEVTKPEVIEESVEVSMLEILSDHPQECMNKVFNRFINVFGVYVAATEDAPLDYVTHTANVLAQYIDNNEDGIPDDPKVLEILVKERFIVPIWSEKDRETFWECNNHIPDEDHISMAASMYYDGDQWAIGGIEKTGTWDTNLEEVWHIVSVGWSEAYPEYFGEKFKDEEKRNEVIPSKLLDAMDAARGGQFISIPNSYPADAWYAYYDSTCDYICMAHEYFYWILMSNIDALDPSITSKCSRSSDEWNICTKSELMRKDILAYELLNNYGFNLPTVIPDGSYKNH